MEQLAAAALTAGVVINEHAIAKEASSQERAGVRGMDLIATIDVRMVPAEGVEGPNADPTSTQFLCGVAQEPTDVWTYDSTTASAAVVQCIKAQEARATIC